MNVFLISKSTWGGGETTSKIMTDIPEFNHLISGNKQYKGSTKGIGMIGALPFSSAVRKLYIYQGMVNERGEGKSKRNYNGPVIISILCDISYPRKRLIPTFLHNLQVAHLDA